MLCSAAIDAIDVTYLGWIVGTASGGFAGLLLIFHVLSAPAFERRVPRAITPGARSVVQWILWAAPSALLVVWAWPGYCVGWARLGQFVLATSLGALVPLTPIVLLFLLTS